MTPVIPRSYGVSFIHLIAIIRIPDQFSGVARADEYRRTRYGTSDPGCRPRFWNSCNTSTPVLHLCFIGRTGCCQPRSAKQSFHFMSGPPQPATSPHADRMSQSFAVPFPQRQRGNPKQPGGFVRVVNLRRIPLHQNSSISSISSTISIVTYDIIGHTLLYYVILSQYRVFDAISSIVQNSQRVCPNTDENAMDPTHPAVGDGRRKGASYEKGKPGDQQWRHGTPGDSEGMAKGGATVGSELVKPKASKIQLDQAFYGVRNRNPRRKPGRNVFLGSCHG